MAQYELSGIQQQTDYCAEWKRSQPQDPLPSPELPPPNVFPPSDVPVGPMPNPLRRFIPLLVPYSQTDLPGGPSAHLTGNFYTYITRICVCSCKFRILHVRRVPVWFHLTWGAVLFHFLINSWILPHNRTVLPLAEASTNQLVTGAAAPSIPSVYSTCAAVVRILWLPFSSLLLTRMTILGVICLFNIIISIKLFPGCSFQTIHRIRMKRLLLSLKVYCLLVNV